MLKVEGHAKVILAIFLSTGGETQRPLTALLLHKGGQQVQLRPASRPLTVTLSTKLDMLVEATIFAS